MRCHWVNEWIKQIITYNLNSLMHSIRCIWMLKAASYLDLQLSIGRDGLLRTSLYDKRDDFNFHITNFPFLSSNIPSSPPMAFLSHNSSDTPGLAPLMNVLFWGRCDFPISFSGRDCQGTFEIVSKEVLWSVRGFYQTIWGPPLPNIKRHSGWWPYTVTPSIDKTLHQFFTVADLDLITKFDFLTNCARFP